jgi:hypothetical protein
MTPTIWNIHRDDPNGASKIKRLCERAEVGPFLVIRARSSYCRAPLSPNFLPLRRFVLLLLFFFAFFFAINDRPPFVIDESVQSRGLSAST